MKKQYFLVIIFVCISSCDPAGTTIIEFKNNSSINLSIELLLNGAVSKGNGIFNVMKNKSYVYKYSSIDRYDNPNEKLGKILFYDLDSKELVKEKVVDKETFTLIKEQKNGLGMDGYFKIEIDDDLL